MDLKGLASILWLFYYLDIVLSGKQLISFCTVFVQDKKIPLITRESKSSVLGVLFYVCVKARCGSLSLVSLFSQGIRGLCFYQLFQWDLNSFPDCFSVHRLLKKMHPSR